MVGESLSRNRDRRACYCGATGVYKITGCWRNAPDLPDVSTCFRSIHAGRLLLCMGLFSIFWQRAPSKGISPTSPAVMPAMARCDTHW